MRKMIFLLILSTLILSELAAQNKDNQAKRGVLQKDTILIKYTFSFFNNVDKTFGYNIQDRAGKIIIHQPNIPALPGNKGFVKIEDAKKVANLVVTKLAKGTFPPTITYLEIQNLNIKF